MLATQVLVCLPIGCVEVLEVLRMLDVQVLVYLSVGLKCWKSCGCWMHRCTCVPISWVEGLELLKMLDAQVLHCLSVGLMCWERFAANTLNVSTIFPSEMLAAQVLQCLSVGLMVLGEFC